MDTGVILNKDLSGGFDLQSTLESGQTYLWDRDDGEDYKVSGLKGGNAWYSIVIDDEVIRLRQIKNQMEWESTVDSESVIKSILRLDDDLDKIIEDSPTDTLIASAYSTYKGMRIVNDPFFACTISFICSAQMRVERIFQMQQRIRRVYGNVTEFKGKKYYEYPGPEIISELNENELRKLGLGYRAPYVIETAEMLKYDPNGDTYFMENYEESRHRLTELKGVGEKVADCICLFSGGHLEAVPLDTWIRSLIKVHYPDCEHKQYGDMSQAIRQRFGPYSGYVQTYIFHYLRHFAGSTSEIKSFKMNE